MGYEPVTNFKEYVIVKADKLHHQFDALEKSKYVRASNSEEKEKDGCRRADERERGKKRRHRWRS